MIKNDLFTVANSDIYAPHFKILLLLFYSVFQFSSFSVPIIF